jgi:hypothetical protein
VPTTPTSQVPTREFRCDDPKYVLGIEPNEHQTPRFLWKYGYHTYLPENLERPNSPNVLPMSRVMLGCGVLRFC